MFKFYVKMSNAILSNNELMLNTYILILEFVISSSFQFLSASVCVSCDKWSALVCSYIGNQRCESYIRVRIVSGASSVGREVDAWQMHFRDFIMLLTFNSFHGVK